MSQTAGRNEPCCGPACCGGTKSEQAAPGRVEHDAEQIREQVRRGYASVATAGGWASEKSACGCGAGGCCGSGAFTPDGLAKALGYSSAELEAIPADANMGLSCGNPAALAALRSAEVVVDLGAGGGFDCFIAGSKVGAAGRVIGVDMTPEMVTKARANTRSYIEQTGLTNVEFRLGEIENLPVADSSADVVISNCVINLSPDKERVWREIARVLRPGGRVAVSDLVLLRTLPREVRADVEALVGCIAGASLIGLVERMAKDAGLVDVRVERKAEYIETMLDAEDPLFVSITAKLPPGERISDYVVSANITARRV